MSNYMPFPSAGGTQYQQPQYQQSQYQQPQYQQQPYMQQQQQQSQQVQPGTITYTTSTGPDGRVIYHPFRAEAATYQTANGAVPGIQWVPADATPTAPQNAQPASLDWIQRWGRDRTAPQDERQWREWLKNEEKRQRRHEKDAARRQKEWDKEAREQGRVEGKHSRHRERRGSFSAGLPAYDAYGYGYSGGAMQPAVSGGFLSTGEPIPTRERRMSQNTADIDRRMAQLELGSGRSGPMSVSSRSGRERRVSFNSGERPVGLAGAYAGSDAGGGLYPGDSRYISTNPGYAGGSPYREPLPDLGVERGYPSNHIMSVGNQQGSISDRRSPNYSYSGLPGTAPIRSSPYQSTLGPSALQMSQMPTSQFPDAFTRNPSSAQNYTFFDPMLISHMDNLMINMPRLPAVLVPHDISHHDWIKFMQDLTAAWNGQLALPTNGRKPRRSSIAANLIDTWNSSFFLPRRIEVVLVKGRTRYSGPTAGRVDPRLLRAVEDALDDSDSSSSDIDDSEFERELEQQRYGYGQGYGLYGTDLPGNRRWMTDTAEARREWRQRKREQKKLKERRKRHNQEKKHKRYSLYVMCLA